MVYIPLLITSLGFFIPTIIAIRNRKYAHGALIGTLACTSCLYHGTLHFVAHSIDRLVAHCAGVVFILHTFKFHIYDRRIIHWQRAAIGSSAILAYWCRSRLLEGEISARWHLFVHIASIVSMTMYCKPDLD
jgi:hypothetical protein